MFFILSVSLECNSVSPRRARRVVSRDLILREIYVGSIKYTPYVYSTKHLWIDVSRKL